MKLEGMICLFSNSLNILTITNNASLPCVLQRAISSLFRTKFTDFKGLFSGLFFIQQFACNRPVFIRQLVESYVGVGFWLASNALKGISDFFRDLGFLLAAERSCNANVYVGQGGLLNGQR
jgi:hypothetical protein